MPATKSCVFQSGAVALGDGNVLHVSGMSTVLVDVTIVTTATVTFEGTGQSGTFVSIPAANVATGAVATTATATGIFRADIRGLEEFRVRVSSWGSGAVTALGVATDGAGGLAPAGASGGSEAHLGEVGGNIITISQTPAITTSLYTIHDAVGGLLTFANAARVTGGSGYITGVTLIDNDKENVEYDLVLFDRTFTATADADTFAPSDADLANSIGTITVTAADYKSFSANAVATVECRRPYVALGTSLFGQLVVRGAPTYTAATDLTVEICCDRN